MTGVQTCALPICFPVTIDSMGSFTVVAQDEVINDHIVPPLIYPNPVASNSTFSIVTEGEFERMEIYNSMGEIVYLDDFHQQAVNAYTIDGLPSGVFIIKLINGKNDNATTFIVQ